MGPKQLLPLLVRVDLGVIAMKGFSTFSWVTGLERHRQMQFSVIPRTLARVMSLAPLQRCSWCTLQTKITGLRAIGDSRQENFWKKCDVMAKRLILINQSKPNNIYSMNIYLKDWHEITNNG